MMNTRGLALALSTVVIAGASVAAMADDVKPVGLSVRAGLFVPSDSGVRDAGSSWFGFGADFKLRDVTIRGGSAPSELAISLDYATKGDFRIAPVTLNFTQHRGDLYYLFGAGIGFSKTATADSTKFAYVAGVGFDFSKGANPLFVEVRFHGNEDSTLNGFGVYLGTRL